MFQAVHDSFSGKLLYYPSRCVNIPLIQEPIDDVVRMFARIYLFGLYVPKKMF